MTFTEKHVQFADQTPKTPTNFLTLMLYLEFPTLSFIRKF